MLRGIACVFGDGYSGFDWFSKLKVAVLFGCDARHPVGGRRDKP
jgi:hypothetical protein